MCYKIYDQISFQSACNYYFFNEWHDIMRYATSQTNINTVTSFITISILYGHIAKPYTLSSYQDGVDVTVQKTLWF